MRALTEDPRLRDVPPERMERAQRIVERAWLRDAHLTGTLASGSCAGLVGVRMRVDLQTLRGACECASPQPCEHVLALLLRFPPLPPPPPPPAPVTRFLVAADPGDPGRLLLAADGGLVGDEPAERLRWVWWRRLDARRLAGEPRTLAQACQLLLESGCDVRGSPPAPDAPLAGALALFRQRALGDAVHVRLLAPTSDAALTLARMLADRGARPHAGTLPAEHWTLPDETAFAGWWLEAWRLGAEARADLALNPKPLTGVDVQLDVGCLPARLLGPPDLAGYLAPLLRGAPASVDPRTGHLLVPASRIVDVEEGLRALGADVCYRRLAPAGERYLQWSEELPEDLHGARPRLRAPFSGGLAERPPRLRPTTTLAPYQEEAVAFIAHHAHTCLLADDMGLGKTLEAIASAQLVEGRILVVCPASAREVWRREVETFTLESVVVLGPGDDPARAEGDAKYVVTGYSNLEALGEGLHPEGYALVILDESHYVKNAASGRARLVKDQLARIPRRLVISGTPVMNTPEEVRAQLAFLHPEEWSDATWFRQRFVEPFDGGTPEVRDAVLKRLRQFLDGVMLRREKSEALPDLPAKSIAWHRLPLAGEARRAYVALEDEFDATARADGVASAKAAGKLERLKQCALAGKLPGALAFVRGVVEKGEKVVVFSRYRDALASVVRELADLGPVSLTGDSTPEERADAETRFQKDSACRVFVGQLVAAGTALTLTAGTHAVFLDLSWNPADHRQAMDRIHRRGQTKPVTVHFFLAEETVDEDVALVLDAKGRMMDALLSGGASGELKGVKRQVGERVLARRAPPLAT